MKRTFKFKCLLKEYNSNNATINYITFLKDITKLLKSRNKDITMFFKEASINVRTKPDLNTYEGRWVRLDKNIYLPVKTNNRSKRRNVILICKTAGIELKNLRGDIYNYHFWNK